MCFKLNSCCCCKLRTGGYILAVYGLLESFVIFITLNTNGLAFCIVYAVVSFLANSALLYGIHDNKPFWILWSIILRIIIEVTSVIFSTVTYSGGNTKSVVKVKSSAENPAIDLAIMDGVVIGLCIMGFVIYLSLEIYFTSVLISLYKRIKENPGNEGTRAIGYRAEPLPS